MRRRMRGMLVAGVVVAGAALGGCASPNQPGGETYDPLEGMNRGVFAFNKVVDDAILGPVSQGYVAITPEPARKAIFNFLDNLSYLTTAINQFLQGKLEHGFEDTGRFVFNSTFGIAGLIDFASGVGFERRDEDFDQTLAVWGVGPGPYLELPVLGPNTVRGLPGLVADTLTDIKTWFGDPYGWIATGVDAVDTRARLDSAIRLRDRTALDPYVFQREAYMQRRRSLVFDGNPPLDEPASSQ